MSIRKFYGPPHRLAHRLLILIGTKCSQGLGIRLTKLVKTDILKSDKTEINFSHMKEGIYFVRLGNQNLKLIVL